MNALPTITAGTTYPLSANIRDGRTVFVWPITPASKPLIAAAMACLSPETSRRRFFAPRLIAMLSKHAPTVEIERDGDGLRADIPTRLVARTLARDAALV